MTCGRCHHAHDRRILRDSFGDRIWHITCRLNPVPVTKRADETCGQFKAAAR